MSQMLIAPEIRHWKICFFIISIFIWSNFVDYPLHNFVFFFFPGLVFYQQKKNNVRTFEMATQLQTTMANTLSIILQYCQQRKRVYYKLIMNVVRINKP